MTSLINIWSKVLNLKKKLNVLYESRQEDSFALLAELFSQ